MHPSSSMLAMVNKPVPSPAQPQALSRQASTLSGTWSTGFLPDSCSQGLFLLIHFNNVSCDCSKGKDFEQGLWDAVFLLFSPTPLPITAHDKTLYPSNFHKALLRDGVWRSDFRTFGDTDRQATLPLQNTTLAII